MASSTLTDCGKLIAFPLSERQIFYDHRAGLGQVDAGLPTKSVIKRYDLQFIFSLLDTYTSAEMYYDGVGNLVDVTAQNGNGDQRTVHTDYDADFGLVPVQTTVTATNTAVLTNSATYNPVTLQRESTTDRNGTTYRAKYDSLVGL